MAFGAFSERELVFAGEGIPAGTLQIVYGANEAGKSTALRAVSGLLFGIPAQTTDAHRHTMTDLRVGAVLEAADGTVVNLIRRKGKKNTLLDVEGNPIDESLLGRLCGTATEATFRALFGLDHVSLRAGAEALLAGQGDVGESLFEAALGGGRGIHRVLEDMEAEADALFTSKGHKRKLNEAINAYHEARTMVRMKTRSGEGWLAQKRALDEARAEYGRLAELARGRKRDLARLERARRLLPLFTRRGHVLGRMAALGEVTPLPPDAAQARESALHARQQATTELARLGREIADMSARRDNLSVPDWMDAPAVARLSDLQDRLGAHRKAARDRPSLMRALAAHEAEADALGRRLRGGSGGASGGAALGLGVAECARVRRLSALEAGLGQQDIHARRVLDDLDRRLRACLEELGEGSPNEDSGALRRLLRRIEHEGDIEMRWRSAVEERDRLTTELGRRVTALGLRGTTDVPPADASIPADQILALAVPPAESVDRYASELQIVTGRQERQADDLGAWRRKQRALERKLVEIAQGGPVPSMETLRQARAARADAWIRLRGAGDESSDRGAATTEAASASTEPPPPSWAARVGAFEGAMAAADAAADQLLRDADRVARAAALRSEREEIERMIADAEVQQADLGRRRDAANLAWKALWAPLGVKPQGPEEMRAWQRGFAEAADVARRLESSATEANKLAAQVRRARDELGLALRGSARFDPDRQSDVPDVPDVPEVEIVVLCEQVAAIAQAREDAASRRTACEKEKAVLVQERARAARQSAEVQAALRAWRVEWTEAIAPLGLSATASPAEAEAVLELAALLGRKQDEANEIKQRVQAIDRDAEHFEESVRALIAVLTPDLTGRPADEAAEALLRRYRDGIPARQARAELDDDLQRRRQARRAAEVAHAIAQEQLAALMAAAGVADVTALEQAERRSTETLDLRRQLREVEDQILELSDRLTLEAALQEMPGGSAEDLDEQIERLREEIDGLDRDTQSASRLIGSTDAGLRVWDDPVGGGGAALASEEAQAHLARVRTLAGQYARLRLGARLLSREIERYREQHQGPVLLRAGATLARLTLGRYTGLRADFDEGDRPVLRCVRADGTKVPVEGLSDGTRDQLYLALRLATLERHAALAEPLPLILDDILIHFDDERAGAALGVLAEHARGTQVVLFTHHARIVELAERMIPRDGLRVSRLDG